MSFDFVTPKRRIRAAGLCAIIGVAGCTGPNARTTPEPTPPGTARREAWHDAELLAAIEPGRDVLLGAGDSMAPIYGDGTILVIRPVAFEDLREGMTVVYLNSEGRRVAHRLVRHEQEGWRAQGLNNLEPDSELVTARNLVGQLYASLARPLEDKTLGPSR
jgi:hypothetical protein